MAETIIQNPEALQTFDFDRTSYSQDSDSSNEDMIENEAFDSKALKPAPTWRKTTLAETLNYPGRVNGKLVVQWIGDDGRLHYIEGSGTLIGPNHVITAAHNIFRYIKSDNIFSHKGWPRSAVFYPACRETDIAQQPDLPYKFYAKTYGISRKFYIDMLPENGMKINYTEDWGIVFLSTSAEKLGRIDLEAVSDNDLFSESQSVFGYPYDDRAANTPSVIKGDKKYDMWTDRGRAFNSPNSFDHDKLYAHDMDVWIGMSGAGLFVTKNDGRRYIMGIQSTHAFYSQNNPNGWAGENRAIKITPGIYNAYQDWLKVK